MIADHTLHLDRLPDGRAAHVLVLRDAAGRVGRGEASHLPGFGLEPATSLPARLAEATAAVRGRTPPDDPLALLAWVDERLGEDWPAPAARAALETALADLAAPALAPWLQPGCGATVAVNRLLGPLDDGWPERLGGSGGCLKVKLGRLPWDAEWAALRELRQLAPRAALRLDCNGRWSAEELEARAGALRELQPEYVEQPLPPAETERMLALCRRLALPLAVDESLCQAALRPRLLEQGGVVFVIKPAVLGGPLSGWRLACQARSRGIECVVTHFDDGPIGRAMARALALAVGGPRAHGVDR